MVWNNKEFINATLTHKIVKKASYCRVYFIEGDLQGHMPARTPPKFSLSICILFRLMTKHAPLNMAMTGPMRRWTIAKLAEKFRIRKQRVMAILALKDLEAQGLEKGELLQGALRAFRCHVDLGDIELDDVTAEPLDFNSAHDPVTHPTSTIGGFR